jgi:gas vesicle protein
MSTKSRFVVTARASKKLPDSLRHNDGIRQALKAVDEYFPLKQLVLDDQQLELLKNSSKAVSRCLFPGSQADASYQFNHLCEISSELFKEVKDIRKKIKEVVSDHEDELESDRAGALQYVKEFRSEMGPALASSIILRRFANFVDAVLLAQIQYSAENVEIELHIAEE